MHIHRSLQLTLFSLLAAALACQAAVPTRPADPPATPSVPNPAARDWYSVYFTDPTDPKSDSLRGGPDKALADAIDRAQASVDMAVLQLNLWSVRDALIHAQQRGLQVRVVIDSDYSDEKEIQALLDAGIPVLGDRREGLMHNKFTIIDRQEVWTGSMNYSTSDGYRNNNNMIRIRSAELAAAYLAEFNEMFSEDQFGPGSPANTTKPRLTVGGVPIQVCFSPDDGCTGQLETLLRAAQKSVHFLAYSFTSDPLAQALIERARRGVQVAGVMEASQIGSNPGTDFELFRKAGIDVRRDGNPRNMHDKVMIIDGRIVVTGSFNYTYYAETRNDENMLVIDDPRIAALYEAEFQKLMEEAK